MARASSAPRPKSAKTGSRPTGSHGLNGNRNYRRVTETKQDDATGTGAGASQPPA